MNRFTKEKMGVLPLFAAAMCLLLLMSSLGAACAEAIPPIAPTAETEIDQTGEGDAGAVSVPAERYNPDQPKDLIDADLLGTSCILIDAETGEILYEKNIHERRYPASTTKIMTLLLAVELGQLDELVEVSRTAVSVPAGSSKTPLVAGERMPLRALLYAMMLPSGNDAANAVAEAVSGSIEAFVELMNARAQQLGCDSTRFANVHGFHDPSHYTTALDIAKIAAAGMRNEDFCDVVGTPYFTLPATKFRAQGLDIENRNQMLLASSPNYYAPVNGIKTGQHEQAGQCFVGSASRSGENLISVTFSTTDEGRWIDTQRLMEYGFAQFSPYTFEQLYAEQPIDTQLTSFDPDDPFDGELTLTLEPGGTLNDYSVRLREKDVLPRLVQIISNSELAYVHDLRAPISKGDLIATLTARYADGRTLNANLLAARDVRSNVPPTPAPIEEDSDSQPSDNFVSPSDDMIRTMIVVGLVLIAALIIWIAIARAVRARERERKRIAAIRRRKQLAAKKKRLR